MCLRVVSINECYVHWLWVAWPVLFYLLLPLNYGASKGLIELVALIGVCVFVFTAIRQKRLPVTSGQWFLLGAMVFYGLIAVWGYVAFPGEEATKKFSQEIKTLLIAGVLVLALVPNTIKIHKVLWLGLLLFVLAGAMSIVVDWHVYGKPRPSIGSGQVIPSANVLVIALALVWVLWPFSKKTRLAYVPLWLFASYALLLTETRGAWLHYLCLLGLIILISMHSLRYRVVALVLAALLLPAVYLVPQVQQRVHEIAQDLAHYQQVENTEADTSIGLRLVMWQKSLAHLAEDPFTARGYKRVNTLLEVEEQSALYAYDSNHVHNEIMQQWLQKGVFGLIAILMLLLVPLVALKGQMQTPALVLSTGAIVAGLTNPFLFQNFPMLFYLVTMVLMQKNMPRDRDPAYSHPRRDS